MGELLANTEYYVRIPLIRNPPEQNIPLTYALRLIFMDK